MNDEPRSFTHEITIEAAPEAVWHALTDAAELVRWFPFEADVALVPGGAYRISWDGNWEWNLEVRLVDPPRRLRLVDSRPVPFDPTGRKAADVRPAPVEVALDYHLAAEGGQTRLRLVHSGFGRGADWDDEFDGISRGWPHELHSLRQYLTRHRGRSRAVAWARAVVPLPAEEVWRRLTGPAGFDIQAPAGGLPAGGRFRVAGPAGDVIEGTAWGEPMPFGLIGSADNRDHGLFRLALDRAGGRQSVHVWLSHWGGDPAALLALQRRWEGVLALLFPEREPNAG